MRARNRFPARTRPTSRCLINPGRLNASETSEAKARIFGHLSGIPRLRSGQAPARRALPEPIHEMTSRRPIRAALSARSVLLGLRDVLLDLLPLRLVGIVFQEKLPGFGGTFGILLALPAHPAEIEQRLRMPRLVLQRSLQFGDRLVCISAIPVSCAQVGANIRASRLQR